MELRPYQKQAVAAVHDKLEHSQHALVSLCVGSGKSIIIAECVKQFPRAVIVQPAQELVNQNWQKLTNLGVACTRIDGAHKGDWGADYIFTTPQTLAKNLNKLSEPAAVFYDEAHWGYAAKLCRTIRKTWANAKHIAFTATPRFYEQKIVYEKGWMVSVSTCKSLAADVFGEPVIDIDRDTMKAMGYGRDIAIEKIVLPNVKAFHFNNVEFFRPLIEDHMTVLATFLSKLNNSLIYADCKAQAEWFADSIPGVRLLLGTTNKKERAQMIADFLDGKVKFIVTVGCGKIGLDLPNLESIIILTDVSNPDLFEQMIGRLNRGDCKKTCYYTGHVNQNKPVVGSTTKVKIKKL